MTKKQRIKLNMNDISIEFPGVKALKNVEFTAETGKVHALVGANGAGKSTLMKVLSGVYIHYTGEIFIDGEKIDICSPRDARENGIEIVYQEVDTALVPYLTVAENIMMQDMVSHMGSKQFIKWGDIHAKAEKILKRLNVHIPVRKLVSDLTLAQKQMVLIARAISRECRFLILDEPTAPLSQSETEELFRIVRDLKEQNVGIIFISHRLPELFEICDDVTIMRDGEFVVKKPIKETNQNEIVEYMLGRKLDDQFPKYNVDIGDKVFEVCHLNDEGKIYDINLYVRQGEVVGIAGLVGAGKTELCKALFAASPTATGKRIICNEEITIRSPYDAVRHGIAFIPEERRKEGLLIQESVAKNLSITNLNKFTMGKYFLDFGAEKSAAKRIIDEMAIKTPNENTRVEVLSGGNQQRVAIGKWFIADALVYIFDEPTKGVDVGAKKDIFEIIAKLASKGRSIIYASCELSEIMGITDRIYVMYDGAIVKELVTKDTSEEEVLFYSTGGR